MNVLLTHMIPAKLYLAFSQERHRNIIGEEELGMICSRLRCILLSDKVEDNGNSFMHYMNLKRMPFEYKAL